MQETNVVEGESSVENVSTLGMGSCPLVLGECVQGRLGNGRHFLITSPIGLFSWAEFTRDLSLGRLVVEPENRAKSLRAVCRYLSEQGLPPTGLLRIATPLDPGQGFGTSTADIAAALRAAAASWGRVVEPEEIARIAIGIEPTDGSMYPGCVAFAHREGMLLESLASLPPFEALVACTGGAVDTVDFDERRRDFRYSPSDERQLARAWDMMRYANSHRDVALMARATTISASVNEQLLPKPFFDEMLRFVELSGVDGLMTAHSGTALALVLDPSRPGFRELLAEARAFLSSLGLPGWFQISNGSVCQSVWTHSGTPQGAGAGALAANVKGLWDPYATAAPVAEGVTFRVSGAPATTASHRASS
jgi:L-threonine kinase